ncbi:LacI family DNA-binding transcriptional regulator [Pararobbsia silviterrae]|uniref:LacI family transcriptional regulator n=1 Tax=Pararobbsia silviterrae TaxID=1792498 RepID=A0A494XXD2_9BURK|nr:LacI family DNA-binding transcriptional regulator [Pararobbsia silviterrae]RKP53678.1 LacI family transcriptional regulator [Pararobbsia silviterrae]
MPSVRDVAKRAGVSISTVSVALNDASRVSAETHRRVMEAVEAIGYAPNSIARSLRLGRTNLIGLIVSEITNPFFAALAKVIQSEALKAGYNLIVCNSDENPARELELLDILRAQRVAGIIVSPCGRDETYRHALAGIVDVPLLTVDRYVEGLDRGFVGLDSRHAGRMVTEYLLRLGHRRIAFVGGPEGISSAELRLAGFRDAFDAAGIDVPNELVWHTDFRAETAYSIVREWMLKPVRPTAFIGVNNVAMIGALQAIEDLGFQCPFDVSLAGMDAFPMNSVIRPKLTVAAQPIEDIGRQAVASLLADVMRPKDAPAEHRALFLSPTLHVGGSCRDLRDAAGDHAPSRRGHADTPSG